MTNKDWLKDQKNYNTLVKYGFKVIRNWAKNKINQQEGEDIISEALIIFVNKEFIPESTKSFFFVFVKNLTLGYLKSKYKTKIDYPESLHIDLEDIEYVEIPIDLSKLNEKTKLILTDKVVNKLSVEEIKKKYKIKSMETVYRQAKNMIEGKRVYRGIARLINGEIDKVYPDIVSVEKDGFNRTTISKCVNGKLKTYNSSGYEWRFVDQLNKNG